MAGHARAILLGAVICATAFGPARAWAAGDAKLGQALFADRCSACHSANPTRKPGPSLEGVCGRRAGTVPNYSYSAALRGASITWDSQTLDRWLTSPLAYIPGVNMQAQVNDPRDRQNIIAYLKSISSNTTSPGGANVGH